MTRPPRPGGPPHPHRSPRTGRRTSSTILDHVERTRRPRRDRHHRPRADRRGASPARAMARDRGLRAEVVVGEEVTTLGGHLLALWIERPIRPYRSLRSTIAAVHDAGRPRHPGPPAGALPAVRPGLGAAPPARRPRPARPSRCDRGVQPDDARPAVARSRRALRHEPRPRPPSATATPTPSRRSAAAGPRSRAARPRTCGARSRPARPRPTARSTARPARSASFGRQLRKRAATPGTRCGGRVRRDGTGRDHGYPGGRARPPATSRRATGTARDPADAAGPADERVKIGLVCPYIYPANGGVAQHVRFLYENLRLRGHDVRILTASHGPQRSSEGDIIRLGVGFSRADQRVGRDADVLAAIPRPDRRRCSIASGSTCSTSTSRSCRSCRSSCCASRSVNIATFHAYAGFSPSYEFGSRALQGYAARLHGRIAVSAAARHFIDRFFPGDYKVIPNGVDIAPLRERRPDRALAGRDAERAVRRPPRAAQGPHRPAQGPPDPAQDGCGLPPPGRRLRAAGARGAALRRDPRPAGRRVPGPRVSDAEKAQLFRTADVFASPATGGESFGIVLLEAMAAGTPIVALRYPRLQGRRPARPRGPAGPAARAARARRSRSTGCSATRSSGPRWAPPDGRGPRPSAGRG